MFWFGRKKLTKWGIDVCSKMLSKLPNEYAIYLEQLNSGLVKRVRKFDDYSFEFNTEFYAKYRKPYGTCYFILNGFMLKDCSGEFVDGYIKFLDGIICSFFLEKKVNTENLNVSVENIRKSTIHGPLPKKILEIICQYEGIDISAIHKVDVKNQIIYHLITNDNSFIGIEENGGEFVEVVHNPLEIKHFAGNFSDCLRNAPEKYRYEGLPKKILNIIIQHDGIDTHGVYRVDIENQIIYHVLDTSDGDFIGIEAKEGKFVYATHDPLEINVITKDVHIYTVNVENKKIYHLFDIDANSFLGVDEVGDFIEVCNNPLEIIEDCLDIRDYLK